MAVSGFPSEVRWGLSGNTKPKFKDPASLTSPSVSRLLRDWERVRQSDRTGLNDLPAWSDFDVAEMGYILGRLNLLEIELSPTRYRFHVHGSAGASYIGDDLTGKYLEDYQDEDYREFVKAAFTAAHRDRSPKVVIEKAFTLDKRILRWEGVILPLANDHVNPSHILTGYDFIT
ncbi:MAG: PAS domain-containing protein [Kiloniellales bacterium]|nr:PAS domain-containing protein [Kiloniellales bacterium]